MYLFGGTDTFSTHFGQVYGGDFLVLDIRNFKWERKLIKNEINRAGHSSVLIKNQLFIIYGNL